MKAPEPSLLYCTTRWTFVPSLRVIVSTRASLCTYSSWMTVPSVLVMVRVAMIGGPSLGALSAILIVQRWPYGATVDSPTFAPSR